jgi:hypothetical protein
MIIKQRYESLELLVYRILNQRMDLTPNQKNYYDHLEKGFEGEKLFDLYLEQNLTLDCHLLNYLLLECNKSNPLFRMTHPSTLVIPSMYLI